MIALAAWPMQAQENAETSYARIVEFSGGTINSLQEKVINALQGELGMEAQWIGVESTQMQLTTQLVRLGLRKLGIGALAILYLRSIMIRPQRLMTGEMISQ